MKIKEILDVDWTVDRIEVTVRDKETSKYIMCYAIGQDVKPGSSERFLYESECGSVYSDGPGLNKLFIRRNIQYRYKKEKKKGTEACVGVLCEEIPKEILELQVEHMKPYHCYGSDDMHGYYFDCCVDTWGGIPGENKQMQLDDLAIEGEQDD